MSSWSPGAAALDATDEPDIALSGQLGRSIVRGVVDDEDLEALARGQPLLDGLDALACVRRGLRFVRAFGPDQDVTGPHLLRTVELALALGIAVAHTLGIGFFWPGGQNRSTDWNPPPCLTPPHKVPGPNRGRGFQLKIFGRNL